MTVPYRVGDRITVTHDTETGRTVTEPVEVTRTVRLNDHRTWRIETDRYGGGVMHLYADAAGVVAVGQMT